jgi:hypothetical protein
MRQRAEAQTAEHRDSANILIAANKQVLTQPKLVYESADLMARSYYKDASGGVGAQTLGVWKGYVGFLYAHHVLTDADGKKLTRPPDYASTFARLAAVIVTCASATSHGLAPGP